MKTPCERLEEDHPGILDCEGWDWRARLPMWTWHKLSLAVYDSKYAENDAHKTWDVYEEDRTPHFVMLEHTDQFESERIAKRWDDIAENLFYYRDWTSSGIPVVSEGETYWSGFWFEKLEDAKTFHAIYGGIATWRSDFKERLEEMRERRNSG